MGKILSLAAGRDCTVLILGAWVCGVFQNNPRRVAETFWDHLSQSKPFWGRFEHILFAVLDLSPNQKVRRPFEEIFSS